MSINHIIRDCLRFLEGVEEGTLSAADSYNIAKDLDPLLVYFVFRYLREKFPATNPNSSGVMGRLLEISSTYPDIVKAAKSGEKDILREWFDDTYSMGEFFDSPERFVEAVVEKVEG